MYDHKKIEEKWEKYWDDNKTFYTDVHDFSKKKYYVLDMFPYPSGEGLHLGHPEGYTATDIVSRMKRMQGFNVLHPMGFDSFGLPAEQYAIKTGNHPSGFTQKNIETFTKQLKKLGFSFDWSKVISTCEPKYYTCTQWIFKQLYDAGLAVEREMSVNWCEELGTVLANDEVIDGKSERGGYPVVRKTMKQWVMRIPEYAERLLEGLDSIDWPESTKEIQKNWIGKSIGAQVTFKVKDTDKSFDVFTTRCDTLFGATYCVLSPEHPLVLEIATEDKLEEVKNYIEECSKKSDLERTDLAKEKTGVFIGAYAINPINNTEIPIYISDYVLATYGTGAIMAVPAHDDRDYEFAKKFNIEIIPVIEGGDIDKEAYTGDGVHINSDFLNGLNKQDAIDKAIAWLEDNKCGKASVSYKIRDWIFARQRYWGEPIPVLHFADGSTCTLDDDELPLVLPELEDYKPNKDGSSPLNKAVEWVNVERDGKPAKRDTQTMPGAAGSSWYWIRYIDPDNDKEFADMELMKHWLPVDLYLGGPEHATGHLLYSRFWNNFLYDKGFVPVKEPFQKLVHQGMILGTNGEKMSKSRGNVINPDDIIEKYGADSLRMFEMFLGALGDSKPWNDKGIMGCVKFLDRVWRLYHTEGKIVDKENSNLERVYNFTVKKVTEDYESLNFNTAISQMMVFINAVYKEDVFPKTYAENFVKLLNPVCPFITEELWNTVLGYDGTISYEEWPTYDATKLLENTVEVVVQVNGKVRDKLSVEIDMDKEVLEKMAVESDKVKSFIGDKEIRKVIVIPNKIVNIVI